LRPLSSWKGFVASAALAVAVLALAACDDAPLAPSASATVSPVPSPSVQAATVPNVFQPPSGPLTAGDSSRAGTALAAAGVRTAQAGSLRMKLVARVGPPGAARSLDVSGTGESESATRSHVVVVITLSGRTITTESLEYDGAFFSRKETEPWRRVSKPGASSADPRGYLNFVSGSRGVVDVGPGARGGAPAEEYHAVAITAAGGNQQVGPAASAPAAPITITAWVARASGRLVGMDLLFPDIGAGPGKMSIDFSDFGATIKVAPPSPAP